MTKTRLMKCVGSGVEDRNGSNQDCRDKIEMFEAGVRQYRQWDESAAGRHILVAVARYIAAHSPTERAQLQTAMVARRLSLGQAIHEEAGGGDAPGTMWHGQTTVAET